MRDRIFIDLSYRDFLEGIKKSNILGFHLPDAKDVFLLAVSLGLDCPKDISGRKDGYFLVKNIRTSDKAFFASITLGNMKDNKDVDKYANDEINYDEAERCAESGFEILKGKIEDSGGNEELLAKRMLSELDLLYEKYFNS